MEANDKGNSILRKRDNDSMDNCANKFSVHSSYYDNNANNNNNIRQRQNAQECKNLIIYDFVINFIHRLMLDTFICKLDLKNCFISSFILFVLSPLIHFNLFDSGNTLWWLYKANMYINILSFSLLLISIVPWIYDILFIFRIEYANTYLNRVKKCGDISTSIDKKSEHHLKNILKRYNFHIYYSFPFYASLFCAAYHFVYFIITIFAIMHYIFSDTVLYAHTFLFVLILHSFVSMACILYTSFIIAHIYSIREYYLLLLVSTSAKIKGN